MTPANPVEALPFARAMRESLWMYPIVEVIHIVGFVILLDVAALVRAVLGESERFS